MHPTTEVTGFSMKKKTRILIADDHTIVRGGIRQLIDKQPDMEVIAEAADGAETLHKAKDLRPDVVLLDISMPKLNGLQAIPFIIESLPLVRIVVLSVYDKEGYALQALSTGANGYVVKSSPGPVLIEAVRMTCNGEIFLSPELDGELIHNCLREKDNGTPTASKYDLLSKREQQVFRLISGGNTTNQIADCLRLSPRTIEKHRSKIIKKLEINDVVGLIKYAVQIGIIDPDIWEEEGEGRISFQGG